MESLKQKKLLTKTKQGRLSPVRLLETLEALIGNVVTGNLRKSAETFQ